MALKQVRIKHKENNVEATVNESSVEVYLDRGWVIVKDEQKLPNAGRSGRGHSAASSAE